MADEIHLLDGTVYTLGVVDPDRSALTDARFLRRAHAPNCRKSWDWRRRPCTCHWAAFDTTARP